ncbi:MAG: pseudouridylate synthase [Bacteroidales bacterium]|nr:pseudouridylate synthase [Bacteroidales bacterium]
MKPFEDITVSELMLQRPPFVFVDRLLYCDEHRAETEFLVGPESVFVLDGALREGGLIEHMAQSCAVLTGYVAKYIRYRPVSIGYLGAVKKLDVRRLPKVGERLLTEVSVIEEFFSIFMALVEVKDSKGELIASAIIKTASQPE